MQMLASYPFLYILDSRTVRKVNVLNQSELVFAAEHQPSVHPRFVLHQEKIYLSQLATYNSNSFQILDTTLENSPWQNLPTFDAISGRQYFGMILRSKTYSIIIYSGFIHGTRVNDMYEYKMYSKEWSTIHMKGTLPVARCAFADAYIKEQDAMIIAFGYDGKNWHNDVWMFSFQTLLWTQLTLYNHSLLPKISMPRYASSGQRMFLTYGTQNEKNSMFVLDFQTMSVSKQNISAQNRTVAYMQGSLYFGQTTTLFVGFDKEETIVKMHVLAQQCKFTNVAVYCSK